MTLTGIAEKVGGADADFIKQPLQFALERLMEMCVKALRQGAYSERSEGRINSRTATGTGRWELASAPHSSRPVSPLQASHEIERVMIGAR